MRALGQLGVKQMSEDVEAVHLMRGFPVIVLVPKDPQMGLMQQQELPHQLGYTDEEFLSALARLH